MEILVAKSYQSLEKIGEPFTSNGRQYITVKLANGGTKAVRVYSEKEYTKYYGKPAAEAKKDDPYYKTQKEVLGFSSGYIWIFTGDTYAAKDWFKEHKYTYRRFWGWSIPGDEEIPEDLPDCVTPVRLDWEKVGNGDNVINEDLIKEAVENVIYEPTDSEYQGNIGDRIEIFVVVEKVVDIDGAWGTQHLHTFRDDCGNAYVWSTTSKRWNEGEEKFIRGTISAHKLFRGDKQTWLKRCTVVSK